MGGTVSSLLFPATKIPLVQKATLQQHLDIVRLTPSTLLTYETPEQAVYRIFNIIMGELFKIHYNWQ